jgi:hypothetical protein
MRGRVACLGGRNAPPRMGRRTSLSGNMDTTFGATEAILLGIVLAGVAAGLDGTHVYFATSPDF